MDERRLLAPEQDLDSVKVIGVVAMHLSAQAEHLRERWITSGHNHETRFADETNLVTPSPLHLALLGTLGAPRYVHQETDFGVSGDIEWL